MSAEDYHLLNCTPTSTDEEIKRAYKKLALKYHPDKCGGSNEKFVQIQAALERITAARNGPPAPDLPTGPPLNCDISTTLEKIYAGETRKLKITKAVQCPDCRRNICPTCRGTCRQVHVVQLAPGMMQQVVVPCQACSGRGKSGPECKTCKGRGSVNETKVVEIHIRAGRLDQTQIVLEGEGEYKQGTTPGPLIVNVKVAPHPLFIIHDNRHLILAPTISLGDALAGTNLKFKHVNGADICVHLKYVRVGDMFKVDGLGMSSASHLFIRPHIQFPLEQPVGLTLINPVPAEPDALTPELVADLPPITPPEVDGEGPFHHQPPNCQQQ